MQFHPLAYIVKLNIEMSMADLIAKIARGQDHQGRSTENTYSNTRSRGAVRTVVDAANNTEHPPPLDDADAKGQGKPWATVTTTVEMHTMDTSKIGAKDSGRLPHSDTDTLIDPASPFPAQSENEQDKTGKTSYRGGSSLSSFNSDKIDVDSTWPTQS